MGGHVNNLNKNILALLFAISVVSCAVASNHSNGGDSAGPDSGSPQAEKASASSAGAGGAPALPATYLDTKYPRTTGKTISVKRGGDFQAALNEARPGDVIALEPAAEFRGNFVLPDKSSGRKAGSANNESGWIIIRPASTASGMPPEGTRVKPSDAPMMPKLISPNKSPALKTTPGADHYRLVGIEFGIAPDVTRISAIIALGDDRHASLDLVPHDIIIDRCFIHGNPTADVRRGIALNSARTSIIDSHISDCHEVGADSQAICGWNGPGPFKIVNNYLEGAAENVMFGGADPSIPELVPSDIEFRRNHLAKPLSWKRDDPSFAGKRWSIKNLFELKNARRVLIDGNLMEYNWLDAQTGYAVVLKSANSSGRAPWAVTEDVTFTNNIVRHSGAGINILGRDYRDPSQQVKRISIKNNLFYGIDRQKWGGDGAFLKITEAEAVTVDGNTIIQTGHILKPYGLPNGGFVFTNNLTLHNKYGVKGDSARVGNESLEKYFAGAVFKKNVIIGGKKVNYPADNFFPISLDEVGIASAAQSAHGQPGSIPYKQAEINGQTIGCNTSELRAAVGSMEGVLW
jgi:hypothetical protein